MGFTNNICVLRELENTESNLLFVSLDPITPTKAKLDTILASLSAIRLITPYFNVRIHRHIRLCCILVHRVILLLFTVYVTNDLTQ